MKAIIYRVEVAEGVLDFLHGNTKQILEAYLPEKDIAFNLGSTGGGLLVHRPGTQAKNRYDGAERIREVDVPPTLVTQLEVFMGLRDTITEVVERSGLLRT